MQMSAEGYQELAYAAGQCGVELGMLERAGKRLEGSGLSMDDAMNEIMSYGTAAERSAKAAELFGTMVAYQLSPLIEQSTEDYEALIQRSHELGLVMSEDDVAAGTALGDVIADIKDSIKMMVVELGTKLTPIIQVIVDKIVPKLSEVFDMIDELWPIIGEAIDAIWPLLEDLID